MIGFLRGKVHAFSKDYVLIDVNGVGYRVNFYHPDFLKKDEEVIIYTYQNVSENDMSLYGFRSLDEYDLFIKLISVKGLGPKMASNMLAVSDAVSIVGAIEREDVAFMKSMPGVGAKTASQIILDLRGKLAKEEDNSSSDKFEGVIEALKVLGYKASEIKQVLKQIAKEDMSEEEYIKKAMILLSKH